MFNKSTPLSHGPLSHGPLLARCGPLSCHGASARTVWASYGDLGLWLCPAASHWVRVILGEWPLSCQDTGSHKPLGEESTLPSAPWLPLKCTPISAVTPRADTGHQRDWQRYLVTTGHMNHSSGSTYESQGLHLFSLYLFNFVCVLPASMSVCLSPASLVTVEAERGRRIPGNWSPTWL